MCAHTTSIADDLKQGALGMGTHRCDDLNEDIGFVHVHATVQRPRSASGQETLPGLPAGDVEVSSFACHDTSATLSCCYSSFSFLLASRLASDPRGPLRYAAEGPCLYISLTSSPVHPPAGTCYLSIHRRMALASFSSILFQSLMLAMPLSRPVMVVSCFLQQAPQRYDADLETRSLFLGLL